MAREDDLLNVYEHVNPYDLSDKSVLVEIADKLKADYPNMKHLDYCYNLALKFSWLRPK